MTSQGITRVQKSRTLLTPRVLKVRYDYFPLVQTVCCRCLFVCTVCRQPVSAALDYSSSQFLAAGLDTQLGPTSAGTKGSSRWFKGSLAQSINKSYLIWCTAHPSPTAVSPWYFQPQARVPRIIRL